MVGWAFLWKVMTILAPPGSPSVLGGAFLCGHPSNKNPGSLRRPGFLADRIGEGVCKHSIQWRLFNSGAAPRFLHHPNGAMLSASTSWVLLRRSVAVLGGAFLRGLIA
jgi:hypothetical protein